MAPSRERDNPETWAVQVVGSGRRRTVSAVVNWDAALSRVLTLKGGERLVTLRDAGRCLSDRFGSVNRDAALEHAIELLMAAAATGELERRKTATDQVARVLRARRLI